MKNLLSIVCMFTVIAYQSAHARDYYGYERVGRDDSDYIYINNERYARVPEQSTYAPQPRYQNVNYNEGRVSEPRYQRQSYQQPRYYDVIEIDEADIKKVNRSLYGPRPYIGLDVGMSSMKINDQKDKYGFKELGVKMDDVFDTKHKNFRGCWV